MQLEQREAGKAPFGESSRRSHFLKRETLELRSGGGELRNTVKVLAKGS
jgi:hypothetical protein